MSDKIEDFYQTINDSVDDYVIFGEYYYFRIPKHIWDSFKEYVEEMKDYYET